jgi:3-oxoacyl-[acyl-carrier protein] reductase
MLDGKIVLVTGASRGIGKAIALTLGNAGATVIGTATSEAGASNVSQMLDDEKISGKGIVLDVTDNDQISKLDETIKKDFGSIDILVNNAGITRDNLFMRMSDEEWAQVLEVNLTSTMRLCRGALRGMMKSRWGRIINISSIVGTTGNPGQGNYAAAKAGMVGMSKSLAYEVASRGVTVNCVAPGFISTPMTDKLNDDQKAAINVKIPAGRMGTPEEIAAAVLYLASNEAGYVTGATLHVNGGMAML